MNIKGSIWNGEILCALNNISGWIRINNEHQRIFKQWARRKSSYENGASRSNGWFGKKWRPGLSFSRLKHTMVSIYLWNYKVRLSLYNLNLLFKGNWIMPCWDDWKKELLLTCPHSRLERKCFSIICRLQSSKKMDFYSLRN